MKKSELRKKYLELRKTLSKDEVLSLSEKVFENFKSNFQVSENQNVHVFLSIEKFNEINTKPFIEFFWRKKANVFVPKIHNGKIISVKYSQETELEQNSWGIFEPKSTKNEETNFDFVITPLLYCDKEGNRIGYGKGFYDQFFQEINPDAKKIGVNFFPPNELVDEVSEFDVKIDYLVLATEVLSFSLTSKSTK